MSDLFLDSIGGIAPAALVAEFGSPLYVYDLDEVAARAAEALEFGEKTKSEIYYAAKANTNLDVLRAIRAAGMKIDAVSPGEIAAAQKAGFEAKDVSYTPNNATDAELRFARDRGVPITLDSLAQLERFGRLFPKSVCGIRVNPDIGGGLHPHVITGGPDSKFGVDASDIGEILVVAQRTGTVIDGYHQHVGSGILDPDILRSAMAAALKLAPQIGRDLRSIDFGGGWGVPYQRTVRVPDLDLREFAATARKLLDGFRDDWRLPMEFRFEPGRRIVAGAGRLLATVTAVKRSTKHTFVGTNTGMNHLIRPALYDAYHDIRCAIPKSAPTERQTIVGNICESGDVLGRDRLLPRLAEGDLLAIMDAGAYGYSMASEYNSRPRPAEVVVEKGRARLSRRRKTIDEIIGD